MAFILSQLEFHKNSEGKASEELANLFAISNPGSWSDCNVAEVDY